MMVWNRQKEVKIKVEFGSFETQDSHRQRFKTGASVARKNGLMFSKIIFLKENLVFANKRRETLNILSLSMKFGTATITSCFGCYYKGFVEIKL